MPFAFRSSVPIALAACAVLIACAGCSAAGGGGGSSSSGNYGNTGGSVKAECTDFTRPGASGNTQADLKKLSTYWDRVAKDAPSDLVSSATSAAQAADKLASGDKSVATSDAFLKGVAAYSTWFSKNCKLNP
jgi:hypothetical protein